MDRALCSSTTKYRSIHLGPQARLICIVDTFLYTIEVTAKGPRLGEEWQYRANLSLPFYPHARMDNQTLNDETTSSDPVNS